MPAPKFTVHVDPDELARRNLAGSVPRPVSDSPEAGSAGAGSAATDKHGTRDERLAARQRSERDHAGRASGTGSSRSYAFRRS